MFKFYWNARDLSSKFLPFRAASVQFQQPGSTQEEKARMARKPKFDMTKEIRKLARERVGKVPAASACAAF